MKISDAVLLSITGFKIDVTEPKAPEKYNTTVMKWGTTFFTAATQVYLIDYTNSRNQSRIRQPMFKFENTRHSLLMTDNKCNIFNPYHAEFLTWNNPSYLFGTVHYHFQV